MFMGKVVFEVISKFDKGKKREVELLLILEPF